MRLPPCRYSIEQDSISYNRHMGFDRDPGDRQFPWQLAYELMGYRSSVFFIEIGFGVLSDEWAPLSFEQMANSSFARSSIPSFR